MSPFLCALVPFLLGAAGLALLWLLHSLAKGREETESVLPVVQHAILWLSEPCERALGKCAAPGALRRMQSQRIAHFLDKNAHCFSHDDPIPTEQQFGTWPRQAELLCQGAYGELRQYQSELRKSEGGERQPHRQHDRSSVIFPILPAILFLLLLIASMATYWLSAANGWCECKPPVEPPPPRCPVCQTAIIDFGADELFAYNVGTFEHERQRELFRSMMEDRIATYSDITIESVTGFTDPIGSAEQNARLATRRAQSIIDELADKFPNVKFTDGKPYGSGPNHEHVTTWVDCLRKHHEQQHTSVQPLQQLSARGPEHTCRPVPSPYYCQKPEYTPTRARTATGADSLAISNNFTALKQCLAPMRRVVIRLRGTPKNVSKQSEPDDSRSQPMPKKWSENA